jgi:aminoglycoside 3-N-acetyltransferase
MDDHLPDFHTRASLREDLIRIGLRQGDSVMIHAAMSKVGPLLNGPDALVHAVLDVIGPDGTLLVYTSWDSVHEDLMDDDGRVLPEWRDHVPGFDPQASRAVRMNGILAEFVRTMPGARRSANPGASVAAIGRLAEWITADHPQDYGYGEVAACQAGGAGWAGADGRGALGYHDAHPSCRPPRRPAGQAGAAL